MRTSNSRPRVLVLGAGEPRPFIWQLLSGLSNQGFEVSLVAGLPPGGGPEGVRVLPPLSDENGSRRTSAQAHAFATIIRAPGGSIRLAARARQSGGTLSAVRTWSRCLPVVAEGWDVVYFPWVGSLLHHQPIIEMGVPVVTSCRGAQINVARHNPRRRTQFDTTTQLMRRVARVHCVSNDIAVSVEEFGVEPSRIRVISPAIDTKFFRPAQAVGHPKVLRLITVGSTHWRKAHEYALLAAHTLLHRGIPVHLTIIGSGPDTERMEYARLDLGLEENVSLLGALDREQVRQELQNATAFVLPSVSEGISNAALEAMACGLPVISTRSGGMDEAIDDGVEGFLVPLRDPGAIADRAEELWRDAARRTAMGSAARERVEREFQIDDQVSAFAELLRGVLDRA